MSACSRITIITGAATQMEGKGQIFVERQNINNVQTQSAHTHKIEQIAVAFYHQTNPEKSLMYCSFQL